MQFYLAPGTVWQSARSSRLPITALKGNEPRLNRVQNHQFHDGPVLSIADINIPVLRHLTGNRLVTQADFQNIVLRIINRLHDPVPQEK